MIGYKLFKIKNQKLYPLYVNTDKETPMGVWVEAECGELQPNGKVKAKLGDGLCYRPGWHISDIPFAGHIGKRGNNGELFMKPNTVWCEVEYSDKINYQEKVNENGRNKLGKIIPIKAYIKEIPVDGYYRYKTNPNMLGDWIIAGAIKINKILSNEEVDLICRNNGIEPQKRAV